MSLERGSQALHKRSRSQAVKTELSSMPSLAAQARAALPWARSPRPSSPMRPMWKRVVAPGVPPRWCTIRRGASTPAELLSTISCVSVGNCVAAGDWVSNQGEVFAETYTEASGHWGSAVDIGQPAHLNNPFVDSISCVTTVSTCTLSGALSDNDGALHAATAQMTSGHWGQFAPAGVPTGAVSDHELLGVSCATGVQCSAVGYYNLKTVSGGTQSMAATWTVGSPPGPVSGLHRTASSATSVQLAWNAATNPGSGIDHYEVTAKPTGGGVIDEGPASGTSMTVGKLLPGTTYVFSVFTVGSDGQTSSAVSVTVALPAVRPTAPKINRVVGLPRALQVSWTSPKSTGGAPITSYDVTAACPGAVKRVHFGGAAHAGVVTGLPKSGTCVVRVAAVNKVGPGPSSAPVLGHLKA